MSSDSAAWMQAFVFAGKGATLTRTRARTTWRVLARFAKARRMILSPQLMTSKQLFIFVEWRTTQVGARTVQNEVSHIRRALAGAGRDLGNLQDSKNNWGSARLLVPAGSRTGGKMPADAESIQSLLNTERRRDIVAALALQWALGLRMAEAIQCAGSLKLWTGELSIARELGRGAFIRVTDGTKGGRPRSVWVPPERLVIVTAAVDQALALIKGGHLVQSVNLLAARRAVSRVCHAGNIENHGLRRAWAAMQMASYINEGLSKKDALRRLSNDLGHGDGRGRWVENNYLKGAGNGED